MPSDSEGGSKASRACQRDLREWAFVSKFLVQSDYAPLGHPRNTNDIVFLLQPPWGNILNPNQRLILIRKCGTALIDRSAGNNGVFNRTTTRHLRTRQDAPPYLWHV